MGDQRRVAELRPRLGEAGDVVAVGVGDEDVGDLDPVALGPLQQRPAARRCRRSGRRCRGRGRRPGRRSTATAGSRSSRRSTAPPTFCPGYGRRGAYGAALEQGAGDQLGVVPGRGVADPGEDEEAGAGGAAVRPSAGRAGGRARTRRSSPARPPGSRRDRRRGCASPGWRRRSPRRRASRGPAARPASGGIRSGWAAIDWKAARRVCGNWRASERNGRAAFTQGEPRSSIRAPPPDGSPRGLDQRPAGERVVTERAQPKRPISSATQPPSELPATCGRSTPLPHALLVDGAGEVRRGRLFAFGQRRRRRRSRACRSRAPRARPPAAAITGSQMLRVPPSPWISSSCSLTRAPGFANSACTSPIRRSRKPASEEER